MTSRDFCYWLQGFFELGQLETLELDEAQVVSIRNHLAMVFAHEIDPSAGDEKHQEILDGLHTLSMEDRQALEGAIEKLKSANPTKTVADRPLDPNQLYRC